ncbi:F-box/kelch-repeat protein At3g23880-like [Rosa rugosa]|uniref:F-box/kelch-repeat protein At3g23880-like n=1 Tax=Rosa rugosa TaxID=74645 RepID=UPI002B40F560|nr:F-box/kelch-repeat protein At3g23880-like [Rosa rugosa]
MSDALCSRRQKQVVHSGSAPSSESVDLDCVIVEILSRLPAKSLLRFRCVCKAWRALISDPYFIRKHLSRINTKSSTSYSLLLKEQIFRSAEYEEILKSLSHDGPLPSRRLDFPVLDRLVCISNIRIVGSCNGLICLVVDINAENFLTFMLWNPCTGECQVLPQPPVHASRGRFFGFGYDSITDDYKVILGSYKPGYSSVENVEFVVAVFMLKRGSWRKLERLNRYFWVSCEGCLVNEALHWVLEEVEDGWLIASKMVSFDLAEEKFHEIPFPYPPNPNDRLGFTAQVGILNNCLALEFMTMGDRGGWNLKMWVLKDYGVKGSWTEVTSIPSEVVDDEYTCMACISDNGEILMQLDVAGPLALYNPKEKTYKTLMGYGGYWYETATYIETLVSPLTGSTDAVM